MKPLMNVYCDESCHLENDGQSSMTLGALWTPEERKTEIHSRIKDIKSRHSLPSEFEIKWTKVSDSKVQFYLDLVDYFFDDDDIHFRCVVANEKNKLDHNRYKQTHDDWYYKMYYHLISVILKPQYRYHIYLDIKDTRSNIKIKKLHDVLCNSALDFSRKMVGRLQHVRSHEAVQVQIADLLIGAMSYRSRNLNGNAGKQKVLDRIAYRSGYSLTRSTLPREEKFNIFFWQAS